MNEKMKKFSSLGFLGIERDKTSERTKSTLDEYERLMKNKELIEDLRFPQSKITDGLWKREGEVEIFLPKKEINFRFEATNLSRKETYRFYTVKIIEVDRKNKKVVVSHVAAQEQVRPDVLNVIDKELKEGRAFRAQAIVSFFTKGNTMAFLDILGIGIKGVIYAKEWSEGYTKSISSVVKRGDLIDIAITGHSKNSKPEDPQYACSRRLIIMESNPWANIEERVPLHSNVIVRCVDKIGRNFLGKIAGEEEVTVFGHYPDRPSATTGESIVIRQGGVYTCYASAVSEKNRVLRVRVIDEIDAVGWGNDTF